MKPEQQASESIILAVLLAFVGGFLDAYTYVCRDQVFANAQTGNIVKLGMAFANGQFLTMIRYLIPMIAFCLGVILTLKIREHNQTIHPIHWRQLVLMIEMLLLFLVGWIPLGKGNVLANILVSLICAMQAECFRKVLGKPFSSTMCTGNLRSGTEHLYAAITTKNPQEWKKCCDYGWILFLFISGSASGVWLTLLFWEKAVLLTLLPLLLALCVMFKNGDHTALQ